MRALVGLVDQRHPPVGHRQDLAVAPGTLTMVIRNALIGKDFSAIRDGSAGNASERNDGAAYTIH